MKLTRIAYEALNSRQKEFFNFQKLAAILADYGFNCIEFSDDWGGADFLAVHKDGVATLRVQLKSRLTIQKTYQGKNLHIAFPFAGSWYLVEHDVLVRLVADTTTWLNTASWVDQGMYHSDAPNQSLVGAL